MLKVCIKQSTIPVDIPVEADDSVYESIERWFHQKRKEPDFRIDHWNLAFQTRKGHVTLEAMSSVYFNEVLVMRMARDGRGEVPHRRRALSAESLASISPSLPSRSSPSMSSRGRRSPLPFTLDRSPRDRSPSVRNPPQPSPVNAAPYTVHMEIGSGNVGINGGIQQHTTMASAANSSSIGSLPLAPAASSSAPSAPPPPAPEQLGDGEGAVVVASLSDPLYEDLLSHDYREACIIEEVMQTPRWFADAAGIFASVAKLVRVDPLSKSKRVCTAFAVGKVSLLAEGIADKLLLLTTHHSFPDEIVNGKTDSVVWDFDEEHTSKVQCTLKRPEVFFATSPALDCTLFVCDPPKRGKRTPIALHCGARDRVLSDSRTYVVQHPGGRPKVVATRGDAVAAPTETAGALLLKSGSLLYTSDTAGGSSGSPVFVGDWQLVALHKNAVPKREKKDGKWTRVKKDGTPWNKGDPKEQLAYAFNQGTLIDDIIQWIILEVIPQYSHRPALQHALRDLFAAGDKQAQEWLKESAEDTMGIDADAPSVGDGDEEASDVPEPLHTSPPTV